MRERWDSRRCFERHRITLQAATIAVNASEWSASCNTVIVYGYIYFSDQHTRLMKENSHTYCLRSSTAEQHRLP